MFCTPNYVSIRFEPLCFQVLHSTVVEILLFMTPRHRAEIVASLVASLNTAYRRFMRRNRHFKASATFALVPLGLIVLVARKTGGAAALQLHFVGTARTLVPRRPATQH